MTKEEIVKALRLCGSSNIERCEKCAYQAEGAVMCFDKMNTDAADLIEAQAARGARTRGERLPRGIPECGNMSGTGVVRKEKKP